MLEERIKVDPAYYEKFSRLIQQAIDDYRARRINELTYLQRAQEALEAVMSRPRDDVPEKLRGNDHALALFGVVKRVLDGVVASDLSAAMAQELALAVLNALNVNHVVDYWRNLDAINRTRIELDHFLYDVVGGERGVYLTPVQMDAIVDQAMNLAKDRGING